MSEQIVFLLYLIYGFVFILMGIIILQLRNKELSGFPLIRILYSLGWFGILHGLSEWVTMIEISGMFNHQYLVLEMTKEVLKTLSFFFLLRFSIMTLPRKMGNGIGWTIRFLWKIPFFLLLLWFIRFIYLYGISGSGYFEIDSAGTTVIIRYLMSFPAGIISFVGLFIGGKRIRQIYNSKLHIWYYGLGWTLLSYGIVDGIFVRKMEFFPANYINHQVFYEITGIPIQVVKIILGILIAFFIVQISIIFEKEKKSLIDQMIEYKAVEAARKELNREIHDRIIQKMFGASLKIEGYLAKKDQEYLNKAASYLKEGIEEARAIISDSSQQFLDSNDLIGMIRDFINEKEEEASLDLTFNHEIPTLSKGKISKEKAIQVYYILQEAVTNTMKHSNASKVWIRLTEEYDDIILQIEDNGGGIKDISEEDESGFPTRLEKEDGKNLGIPIMKSRADEIGGRLEVTSSSRGVMVKLIFKSRGDLSDERK